MQNRYESRIFHVRLEPVVDKLPADFGTMRGEARAEGYAFLDRLATDWAGGLIRFDKDGEALLAAYSDGVLAALGGITSDPFVPDALRMRRFYVRSAFRRAGIGHEIAHVLLERAFRTSRVVTLNAAVSSVPFWEKIGFVPQVRDGHTHVHCQADPLRIEQESLTTPGH
jgi:GNAT superfamily N-acetyltransferase